MGGNVGGYLQSANLVGTFFTASHGHLTFHSETARVIMKSRLEAGCQSSFVISPGPGDSGDPFDARKSSHTI